MKIKVNINEIPNHLSMYIREIGDGYCILEAYDKEYEYLLQELTDIRITTVPFNEATYPRISVDTERSKDEYIHVARW